MEQKRQIAILGSTGSIGTQALEVIEEHSDLYEVYCLTANNKVELLAEQAHKFKPAAIVIANEQRHYEIQSFIDGTIMTLADAPWPGLTPDLLSVLIVVATQARGSVLFHQKMFESRLFFVDRLIDMGAQIILCDPHRAVVVGHDRKLTLRASRMSSPDIRAGIALLIAAMSANGTSRIDNIEQIDRGYEHIEHRLNALGARISREQ